MVQNREPTDFTDLVPQVYIPCRLSSVWRLVEMLDNGCPYS